MSLNRRISKKRSHVRYLRLLNNVTIGELAYKAKIDRLTLEKIEMGAVPCSELNARRIATFFGTPYEWESFVTRPVEYA
jgi:DNA-binding XRE family transcriptional regulator